MTGDCVHGYVAAWCSFCRNADAPRVVITAGGQMYHRSPTCWALLLGQQRIEGLGGTAAPIETVQLASDRVSGRSACSVCAPELRR
jgi:phage FluMu protein gp41